MPAPALNGYALTNYFRKLRLRVTISHLQAYLFFELVAICNDEGWPAEFSASNGVIQAALGCSEEGLIRARLKLQELGLIDFVSGNRRTPTRYRFTVQGSGELSHSTSEGSAQGSTHLSDSPPNGSGEGSVELSHKAPQAANGSGEGSAQGSGELSPYKEQTKTKRTNAQSRKNDEVNEEVTFDAFWEAYAKKVDHFRSKKKWLTLTAAEQAAALANAPHYAAATPDKKFRKDPLTYLNGKCWLDEDLPGSAAPTPAHWPAVEPAPEPELNHEFLAELAARQQAEQDARLAHFATA